MNARDRILSQIKVNQPPSEKTEKTVFTPVKYANPLEQFKAAVTAIGGSVIDVESMRHMQSQIKTVFPNPRNIFTGLGSNQIQNAENMNSLADLQVAVLIGEFGVAENGAVWITNKNMPDRALPFICEHLAIVLDSSTIVANLHEAYELIQKADYEYGSFIAGPSKTADIEQSLVLGAHGPKSLTVFLILG